MSAPLKDGGPAFPTTMPGFNKEGMSLRAWFAGKALNGLVSQVDDRACPKARIDEIEQWRHEIRVHDAKWCVQMADAMLAELAREKP